MTVAKGQRIKADDVAGLSKANTFDGQTQTICGNDTLYRKFTNLDYTSYPTTEYQGFPLSVSDKNDIKCFEAKVIVSSSENSWLFPVRHKNGTWETGFKHSVDDAGAWSETPMKANQLGDSSNQVVNTKWISQKFQKVSAMPASPDPNVIYFVV